SISASFSLLFHMYPPPPRSTLFPYTTLFRSDRVIADLRTRIGGMSTKLRLVRPLDYYTEFVASQTMTGNQLLFMPKWELLALLPGLNSLDPSIEILPQHAQLSIDVNGLYPPRSGETRVLEASLF